MCFGRYIFSILPSFRRTVLPWFSTSSIPIRKKLSSACPWRSRNHGTLKRAKCIPVDRVSRDRESEIQCLRKNLKPQFDWILKFKFNPQLLKPPPPPKKTCRLFGCKNERNVTDLSLTRNAYSAAVGHQLGVERDFICRIKISPFVLRICKPLKEF